MKIITVKAPAKINWYLNILNKRDDGYHDIETVMQTIDIFDMLTIEKAAHSDIKIEIENNAYNIDTGEKNIVYKAAKALDIYGVNIKIKKNIPVEAGLGGGSSDAASAMLAYNDIFELGLTKKELAAKAAAIGADVPFFIYGGACIARGIGDILEPIKPVTTWKIKIKKPSQGISTGKIYAMIDSMPKEEHPSLDDFLIHFKNKDELLAKYMYNAMEKASVSVCPQIEEAKKYLIEEGCVAAMMSGSGSAVFGIEKI